MKTTALLVWLLSTALNLFGQQLKEVGYTQLANAIFFSGNELIKFDHVHFINDLPEKGAEVFVTTYIDNGAPTKIYGGFKKYLESKNAKKDSSGRYFSNCRSIEITNSKFDNDIRFSNVNFRGTLTMANNDFPTQSEDYVGLYGQVFGGAVLIDSCKFNGFDLSFLNETLYRFFFKFNHSEASNFGLELQKSGTQIMKSKLLGRGRVQIHGDSWITLINAELSLRYLELDKIQQGSLYSSIVNNSTEEFSQFTLDAERIDLSDNEFNANMQLYFSETSIYLSNDKFKKKLALDFRGIIKNTSYISLGSLKDLNIGTSVFGEYYDASSKKQINDDEAYKKHLRVHKQLYDHFKEVGDTQSANAVYVRIREIENAKLHILYDSIPSFQNYFSLNLNRLLKFYTNYGTDPAKALVISFYIIFVFGVFYFFFPSDWDITSKSRLVQNFRDFIEKNEKGYFKPFLTLTIGFLTSIVNAVTLSLNAFTTLGFGNIPTHGLARYVCVIQGFIGWFLLSIFTVALINQAQF